MELYSQESERAVLSSMLCRPESIDEASEMLYREDFFVPAHQEIFETLCEMRDHNKTIDIPTIHQNFSDRLIDGELGSPGILAELVANFVTHLNINSYIKIVKDKSTLRNLQSACSSIVQNIYENSDEVDDVLADADAQISRITAHRERFDDKNDPTPQEVVKSAQNRLEAIMRGEIEAGGLLYGLKELDDMTGGAKRGEYVIIAARTSVGKTALAIQFRNNFCSRGHSVGVFSLEMNTEHLQARSIAWMSGVDGQKIFRGNVSQEELESTRKASECMMGWKMHHFDMTPLNGKRIRAIARKWKRKHNVEAIIVDYLQLVDGDDDSFSRENEISKISKMMKSLAKELDCAVIVLAQLNRKSEESDQPLMHHLRESGSLEQDSDTVMLLHCLVPKEKQNNMRTVEHDLLVCKQRNGPTGKIKLLGIKNQFKFIPKEIHSPTHYTPGEA